MRRDCLRKHVTEGKIVGKVEVRGRQRIRRMQLLDDMKEKRRYWKLKEEAKYRSLSGSGFGKVYGPIVRQIMEWMNEWIYFANAREVSDLEYARWCNWIPYLITQYAIFLYHSSIFGFLTIWHYKKNILGNSRSWIVAGYNVMVVLVSNKENFKMPISIYHVMFGSLDFFKYFFVLLP